MMVSLCIFHQEAETRETVAVREHLSRNRFTCSRSRKAGKVFFALHVFMFLGGYLQYIAYLLHKYL